MEKVERMRLWRRAAEHENAIAQFNLGVMCSTGKGVRQRDDAEAARWYRLAVEQDDTDALYNLGGIYFTGRGVPKDDAEAWRWWLLAAEQGHKPAEFMGVMENEDLVLGSLLTLRLKLVDRGAHESELWTPSPEMDDEQLIKDFILVGKRDHGLERTNRHGGSGRPCRLAFFRRVRDVP